ncbi:hypothetical protein Pla52n_66520 [Stieleria varia]|uniref:Uncharacterized protein n=1 Tax=Stieleria varia TaxID=2528005 RepID=A0A5C5ZWA6_9BACT|nr:hypothetical protein Pla52n_66520 [Stieleria varia]
MREQSVAAPRLVGGVGRRSPGARAPGCMLSSHPRLRRWLRNPKSASDSCGAATVLTPCFGLGSRPLRIVLSNPTQIVSMPCQPPLTNRTRVSGPAQVAHSQPSWSNAMFFRIRKESPGGKVTDSFPCSADGLTTRLASEQNKFPPHSPLNRLRKDCRTAQTNHDQ